MKRRAYVGLEEWLSVFKKAASSGSGLVPVASLMRSSGLSEAAVRKRLQRLRKRGLVFRAGPNAFACRLFPPSLENVAMSVGRPCYVSFESALSRQGILSQTPMCLTCATRGRPRTLRSPVGEIALRHISERLFWGFREEDGVLWAEPEKALLDWVYWRLQTAGEAPAKDELMLDEVDGTRLKEWGRRFPATVLKALT